MGETRRDFLKKAGLGALGLTILPRNVFGKMGQAEAGFVAPSDQITKGIIGVGGMGNSDRHFNNSEKYRLISICDVDSNHLQRTFDRGKRDFGIELKTFHDFRELCVDPDIDVVHIATPPHWHGLMSIAAAAAGKDVWCEKPMTRTIGEGKKVVEAMKKYGRVFRLNTWFRFTDTFYGLGTEVKPLKKLIDSGLLGWPLTVRISGATGFAWKFYWTGKENLDVQPIPEALDYDFWLGPAPYKPYNAHRTHGTFRGYWDYDNGGLGDMGQHYIDPVQYMLGKDDDFPVKVEVDAPQQHPDAVGIWRSVTYTYADGCKIILEGEGYESKGKVPYIEGPKGKVYKGFECTIPHVQDVINELPDPAPRHTDFLECIRSRQHFALDEINGYHSCTVVNMGAIAVRLGRTLHFDPKTQTFIGDDAANNLINQPMREPWASMI